MEEHLHRHRHTDMISVEDALEHILKFCSVLSPEAKPISDALGQVLAENIVGRFDMPRWDNSAMDGYAVRANDIKAATNQSPTVLKVVGTIAAGDVPHKTVESGTAIRIMTGAPIPTMADAVVPFEDTDELERKSTTEIGIQLSVRSGSNIRAQGRDIKKGQPVIDQSKVLKAADIGVLASLGYSKVQVVKRPTVGILATGDELVDPKEPLEPGKIYNSNSYSIAAAVQASGGIPWMLGIASDTRHSISSMLDKGINGADILITTAGVSKGDYDLVKNVLTEHGKIELWSVRMRPAKPLAFGLLNASEGRRMPILGLPGNPVSSLVAFEQFGRPALRKMMGFVNHGRPRVQAILEDAIVNSDGRRQYARVIITKRDGTYYARLTGDQGSNILTSMSLANGLAICPEETPRKEIGETIDVEMLEWPVSYV